MPVTLHRSALENERALAALAFGLLVAVVAVSLPFRHVSLGVRPVFLVFYAVVLGTTEILTAIVLYWRARTTGDQRFAILSAAYTFSAPLVLGNVFLFPGMIFGAAPHQSAPWLWISWHLGWSALVIVFACVPARHRRRAWLPIAAALAASATVSAIALTDPALPVLLRPDDSFSALLDVLYVGVFLCAAAAVGVLLNRRRHEGGIDAWILVAALAITLDIVATALGSVRFSVGFYVGRSLALLSGITVLTGLLLGVVRMLRNADRTEESERRLRAVLEGVPQMVWFARADGEIEWQSRRWEDFTGQQADASRGFGWQAAVHPDDLAPLAALRRASVERREAFEMALRLRGSDGNFRWFLASAEPQRDGEGRVARWSGTYTNIDQQQRVKQQLDFFASLGDSLVRTLDRNAAIHALSSGLVPSLADWTLVNLADPDGRLILRSAFHPHPQKHALLQTFLGTSYDLPDARSVSATVYRTGKPEFGTAVGPATVRDGVIAAFGAAVEQIGMHSYLAVPIVANGVVYGSFHVLASDSDITYTEADVPFFAEVGRRIGYALQNADMYEREARIARTFQAAALPATLAHVPGSIVSYLYESGSREANVGGDFYDAFRLEDGRIVISIGDIAGSGIAAAATMGALRQSIRAVAGIDPDPHGLLRAAKGVFDTPDGPLFASAFVAVIDPITLSMRYANAGHPPPIVRAPDGSTERLTLFGPLLGLKFDGLMEPRQVGTLRLQPGTFIVLYTDGLSEAKRDALADEERLLEIVQSGGIDPACAASVIRHRLLGPDTASHDDLALLTVFIEAPLGDASPLVFQWRFDHDDGYAAHRAREAMAAALGAANAADADIFAAEMIFAELVGNVSRHAASEIHVILDLTQGAAVLHVLDGGDGFFAHSRLPVDPYAERGRGLFLIAQLARQYSIMPRSGRRGTHARVVLNGQISPCASAATREAGRTPSGV